MAVGVVSDHMIQTADMQIPVAVPRWYKQEVQGKSVPMVVLRTDLSVNHILSCSGWVEYQIFCLSHSSWNHSLYPNLFPQGQQFSIAS